MNALTTVAELSPEDTTEIAWLASDTLQHPQRYARGRKLLVELFSPIALGEQRRAQLSKVWHQERHRDARAPASAAFTTARVKQARGHAACVTLEACLGEALVYVVGLPLEMDRAQAEAVCLIWLEFAGQRDVSDWLDDASGNSAITSALQRKVALRLVGRLRPKLMHALEMIRPNGAAQLPSVGDLDERSRLQRKASRLGSVPEIGTEARLLALIAQNPGLTVSKIAGLAGVNRTTPYRYSRVKLALRARGAALDDRKSRAWRAMSRNATDDATAEE